MRVGGKWGQYGCPPRTMQSFLYSMYGLGDNVQRNGPREPNLVGGSAHIVADAITFILVAIICRMFVRSW